MNKRNPQSDDELSDALNDELQEEDAFADRLASLRPAEDSLDRAEVLFQAGFAAGQVAQQVEPKALSPVPLQRIPWIPVVVSSVLAACLAAVVAVPLGYHAGESAAQRAVDREREQALLAKTNVQRIDANVAASEVSAIGDHETRDQSIDHIRAVAPGVAALDALSFVSWSPQRSIVIRKKTLSGQTEYSMLANEDPVDPNAVDLAAEEHRPSVFAIGDFGHAYNMLPR